VVPEITTVPPVEGSEAGLATGCANSAPASVTVTAGEKLAAMPNLSTRPFLNRRSERAGQSVIWTLARGRCPGATGLFVMTMDFFAGSSSIVSFT